MANRHRAERFVEQLQEHLSSGEFRNPASFDTLIASEVTLHTPRFWKPITDRQWMMGILSMIPQVIDGFTYHRIWIDGDDVLMEFRGTVDGKSLHGIDIFTLDDHGRVSELSVMMRPPNAVAALGEKEDAMLKQFFGVGSQAEFVASTKTPPPESA